jgi:predicted nucleotide-binding protein (sugar kinase/HSP70/actin superfamily)
VDGSGNGIPGIFKLHFRFHAEDEWKETNSLDAFKQVHLRKWLNALAKNHEHILFEAVKPYVGQYDETSPEEVVEIGSKYVTKFFGGEAVLSMGKCEDFALRNLDGVVSVAPFNCMPSLVVSALSRELRQNFNKIPFLNIDFDGFDDNTREQRISAFVSQVKERNSVKTKESADI